MGPARAFLYIVISWIAGVGVRTIVHIPWKYTATAVILAVGILVVVRKYPRARQLLLCCIACALGMLRYDYTEARFVTHTIKEYAGRGQTTFTAVVSAEPDVRQDQVKLTVDTQNVYTQRVQATVQGKVLITTPLYPEYGYGDVLRITCALEVPEEFDGFAYDKYLLRYGITAVCRRAVISHLHQAAGSPLMRILLGAKAHVTKRIEQVVPEPEASFLGGLLVGAKHGIPPDLTEAFRMTGTSHIVALSGFNITIIGVFIQHVSLALGLGRRQSMWVSLGAIVFFVSMTGAQSSVVRAGIMGSLVLIARRLGRASRITNALVLTAAVMIFLNPVILRHDIGFQLSFLSTSGLVYLTPLFERWCARVTNVFQIRSNLISTLSATLATSPVIIGSFGSVSLISPIVNIAVLPLIPLAMGVGFIAAMAAVVWLPIGTVLGIGAWGILRTILWMIEYAARMPFASVSIPGITPSVIAGMYALVVSGMVMAYYKKRRTQYISGMVAR